MATLPTTSLRFSKLYELHYTYHSFDGNSCKQFFDAYLLKIISKFQSKFYHSYAVILHVAVSAQNWWRHILSSREYVIPTYSTPVLPLHSNSIKKISPPMKGFYLTLCTLRCRALFLDHPVQLVDDVTGYGFWYLSGCRNWISPAEISRHARSLHFRTA